MALVKCSECHHDISDKARICPHCGTEYRHATSRLMDILVLALKSIGVVFAILIGIAIYRATRTML